MSFRFTPDVIRPVEEIHPAPAQFTREEVDGEPILRFFHYAHLPPSLQEVSVQFFELASFVFYTLPRNAERTTALRKLLEAKDCAIRARVGGLN